MGSRKITAQQPPIRRLATITMQLSYAQLRAHVLNTFVVIESPLSHLCE